MGAGRTRNHSAKYLSCRSEGARKETGVSREPWSAQRKQCAQRSIEGVEVLSSPPRQDLNGSNGLSRSCGKFKPASNRRNPIAARRSSLRRFSCLLSKKARKSKNLILPIVHRDALRFSPIPAHIGAAGIARNRVRSGVYGVSHGHADLQSFPPHAARVADHR